MNDDDLTHQIEELKTNEQELNQVLERYDLDEALALEFNNIDQEFRKLEVKYQSLINARKFLNNG